MLRSEAQCVPPLKVFVGGNSDSRPLTPDRSSVGGNSDSRPLTPNRSSVGGNSDSRRFSATPAGELSQPHPPFVVGQFIARSPILQILPP